MFTTQDQIALFFFALCFISYMTGNVLVCLTDLTRSIREFTIEMKENNRLVKIALPLSMEIKQKDHESSDDELSSNTSDGDDVAKEAVAVDSAFKTPEKSKSWFLTF